MFDVGWPELFVIAAVALVAIGPKELPAAMHKLGKMAGRIKSMGQSWQSTMDRLAYEADVVKHEEVRKEAGQRETTNPASKPPAPNK
jgi:sec-independent protein translocase protein TatB